MTRFIIFRDDDKAEKTADLNYADNVATPKLESILRHLIHGAIFEKACEKNNLIFLLTNRIMSLLTSWASGSDFFSPYSIL